MGLTLLELKFAIAEHGLTWVPNEQAFLGGGTGSVPSPADLAQQALLDTIARITAKHPNVGNNGVFPGLPSVVDWRDRGIVPSAPDPFPAQWPCGSCVSFAVTGMVAAMAVKELGLPLQFQLSSADSHFCSSHGENGGGWNAHDCLQQVKERGVVTEGASPYGSAVKTISVPGQSALYSVHCNHVPNRKNHCYFISDISALKGDWRKWYLHSVGPMVAHMKVYPDFNWYGTGVYGRVVDGDTGAHAVLVIGYNDLEGAWICRNSWGKGFGLSPQVDGAGEGFFKIAYGEVETDDEPFWGASGIIGPVATKELARSTVKSGFTSICPLTLTDGTHLLGYDSGNGEVQTFSLPADGSKPSQQWSSKWKKGWSTVKAYRQDGKPLVLLYNRTTGDAKIIRAESSSVFTDLPWRGHWNPGWDVIEPFYIGNEPYVISYMSSNGRVDIDKFNADGQGTKQTFTTFWKHGWTAFAPFSFGSETFVFQYSINGAVAIDMIVPGGFGTLEIWRGSWSPGWTHIVPFLRGGWPHLLSYKHFFGDISVDRINAGGVGTREAFRGSWAKDWAAIQPFLNAAGSAHFVEYKSETGVIAIDQSIRITDM